MVSQIDRRFMVGLALGLVMALTRLGHIGHWVQPADASWAVFLLGGALLRGRGAFIALCAGAAALDLVAFAEGVSRACMSPGYVSLLPAYWVLWWGGRLGIRDDSQSFSRLGAAAVVATTLAFAITNVGYFALSSSLAAMPLTPFVARVSVYYPWYVLTTLGYALCGYALARWARLSPAPRPKARAHAG